MPIWPENPKYQSISLKKNKIWNILCFIVSRGIFNQGYLCLKCGLGAHKQCLGQLGVCERTGEIEADKLILQLWSITSYPRKLIASFPLYSLYTFMSLKFLLKCCDLYSSATTRSIFPLFHPKYQNLKGRLKWNLLSTFMYPRGAHLYILVAPWAQASLVHITSNDWGFCYKYWWSPQKLCECAEPVTFPYLDNPWLKFAVEHTFTPLSKKI